MYRFITLFLLCSFFKIQKTQKMKKMDDRGLYTEYTEGKRIEAVGTPT